jgi:hypothetical protein
MTRRILIPFRILSCVVLLGLVAGLLATPGNSAELAELSEDEQYFVERVYRVFETAQCRLCHGDLGVASGTDLLFPAPNANQEQILAFGLQLRDLIDPVDPAESWLLQKSTNREEHTGGVRILPGSEEEELVLTWAKYLARWGPEENRAADEKIARARRYQQEPLSIRRLTHSQYNNTVRDLLGDLTRPASRFPKEDFIHGFTNQVAGLGISPLQAEGYSEAAERLAQAAFRGSDPYRLLPITPEKAAPGEAADPEWAEVFVREFGRKAFRRPLAEGEIELYTRLLLEEVERTGDPLDGPRLVVEAMLQSPHFLYRIDRGAESPLRAYEIASRLSYFLWDTMPDDELLRGAESGELDTVAGVEAWTRRMLDDSRARAAFDEFLAQWMRFDRVLSANRDRRRFPEFSQDTAVAMTEETRRLFHHVVWEDRSFLEFLTADYTFVNGELAQVYGMPEPSEEFERVRYPEESGRSGVLGHGALLLLTSKPGETSPTSRGLFIRNQFLAQDVPPPPPDASTELPDVTEDRPMTNRERLDAHLNRESCAGCHRLIDPIGLGFEQYNAIGAFEESMSLRFGTRAAPRMVELELDTTAHIQGLENSNFSTPKELGHILAESEMFHRNVVKQVFRYAMGRLESDRDRAVIDSLVDDFRESDFRFRELIVSLVTSELFLEGGSNQP